MITQAQQWRDPTGPNTWRLACHEAGHAVAEIALNREFHYVTLVPTKEWAGAVVGVRPLHRPLGGIVTKLAGPLSEVVHAGSSLAEAICVAGHIDTRGVFDRGDGLAPDAFYSIIRRTMRIVRDTHRHSVLAVATALLQPPQRLTHDQVAAIVEDHQPGGLAWLIRETENAVAQQKQEKIA